jgi:hypothetical protein
MWLLTVILILNQIIDLYGPLALLNTNNINKAAQDALVDASRDPLKVYINVDMKYKSSIYIDLTYLLLPKLFTIITY